MGSILLILLYTALGLLCLLRITRKDRINLPVPHIVFSYGFKILAGLAYGYIFLTYYNGDDTWKYHNFSITEYHVLLKDPLQFFANIVDTTPGSMKLDSVYDVRQSFWNNLEDDLFIRLLALLNVFSFGNYYVNVVLFCFLVYLGHLMLLRLFTRYFPDSTFLLRLYIFYLPAIVFWLSGIRKDGLLFLAMAATLYYFDKLVRREKHLIKNILLFITGFLGIWLMRNFLAMCLTPALFAWFIQKRFKSNGWATYGLVYGFSILIFFNLQRINGLPDLAWKVTERQYAFMALDGKTRLGLDSLDGSAASFGNIMPQALNHSFLRPFISEGKGLLQVFSATDMVLFFFILAMALIFRHPQFRRNLAHPLVLCCLFSSFFGYLIIGYVVPFPGAIVRYKIIFELLFLCSFAVLTFKKHFIIKK